MFVRTQCFCPRCHAAALEPVAATDDSLEIRHIRTFAASFGFARREGGKRIGNEHTCIGAKAVVIENKVLEWSVFFKKGDEWSLCVEAESIVGEVDGVEVLQGD